MEKNKRYEGVPEGQYREMLADIKEVCCFWDEISKNLATEYINEKRSAALDFAFVVGQDYLNSILQYKKASPANRDNMKREMDEKNLNYENAIAKVDETLSLNIEDLLREQEIRVEPMTAEQADALLQLTKGFQI